jgi:FixJ family two-component response regulator
VAVPGETPVVCIVDDEPSVRRALTTLLRGHGLTVEAHGNPDLFLQRMRAGLLRCAVLVLDVHLGVTSGFEVYDRLATSGTRCPTIFITGRDESWIRARATRRHACAYLVKPLDDAVFLRAIEAALAEARPPTSRSS